MKNKSVGFYGSSLEMLLDTMCAMLGGVVFISLMVAMFAQDSTTHTTEQFRKQAAQLSNDLAQVIASNTVVQSELLATLQRLQDPRLQPVTNKMRLPNIEKHTTKQQWVVIMQYGKIYPLDVFSSDGRFSMNRRDILYQRQSGQIMPKPDQGEEPESGVKQMVQAFKANAQTNFYFAFAVYADSFDAFMRARDTAAGLGFQYGLKPLLENTPLQVGGQEGETILPQN
jgi:DNA gyrase/topoisomerase IV subunit A